MELQRTPELDGNHRGPGDDVLRERATLGAAHADDKGRCLVEQLAVQAPGIPWVQDA